ncbi:MAG: multicopper oxidase domain-containing protein [Bdellovibrionaceae bacterium]|nr:multicopper oxidase domain-containing protein [Pseudobdellovibrionaceae bacterium]
MRVYSTFLLLAGLIWAPMGFAKTVRYELVVEQKSMNLSGKKTVDFALTVNGSIPAPTLEFTEGDEAEILVINKFPKDEVSIHWHGLLLPPEMDGVAYVNTPPILPGQSHLFKFPIRQHGTYWYHSHTNVQEQKGVYGAFIIHPKKPTHKVTHDVAVVLSDWSDEDAMQILKNLRKDGDYYLYKKDSIRSIGGALKAGALGTYLGNEWTRMGGMDLSDVGYDAFLINGKKNHQLITAHPGETVRLRIINAGASSYFYVSLGGLPMKVIAADGVDIEPITTSELLMGMAETYDVLFSPPEHKNYELRATVQDVTGFASAWIGMAEKVPAPNKPLPDLYASMDHSAHGTHDHSAHEMPKAQSTDDHSHHEQHDHHDHSKHASQPATPTAKPDVETLTVDHLKALEKTAFSGPRKIHDVKLVLDGDMERYVWHINGKAMFEDRNILIQENDVVRFTFENNTMMHHPMHLHGHFFRVLNANGDRSPLKHTVDVSPHQTRVIEFLANEPGEWMLHCHNLYHMKTGMARVVKYSTFTPKPEVAAHQSHDPHLHDHWYFYGRAKAATNHAEGALRLSQTWNQIDLRVEGAKAGSRGFESDGRWSSEGDLLYRRWFGRLTNLIIGGTHFAEETSGLLGVGYLLPLLIESNWLVDHHGEFRLDLGKRLQWTRHFYSDVEFTWRPQSEHRDHRTETELSLMYSPSWSWSVGLMLTSESLGAGFGMQF